MRKLLEVIGNEEYKKSLLSQVALMVLTLALCVFVRTHDRNFFDIDFYVEFAALIALFRFYLRAFKNKNYAYWGISILIGLYLLRHILHFTFIEYNIFILYVGFLSVLFLILNCYVMSSPLYYPRVQWWEYDFRYKGDLKAILKINKDNNHEARVTDLRRACVSIEAFEYLELGSTVTLEVKFGSKVFEINGELKTNRQMIPGRPYRYGIKISIDSDSEKKVYNELKKVWNLNKNVKIRRKFADLKESGEN